MDGAHSMDFSSFDAFDAGIDLGGLRNRSEIRLLVCYLLRALDRPIPKALLVDAVLREGLANYFELNEAIAELLKAGNIDRDIQDGEEVLTITARGRESAELLETELPRTVREKAVNSAIKLMTLARNKRENKILTEPLPDGGFNVTFILGDEENEMMRLTIYVADRMQVEVVKKNFLEDPVKLYSSILAALTV